METIDLVQAMDAYLRVVFVLLFLHLAVFSTLTVRALRRIERMLSERGDTPK